MHRLDWEFYSQIAQGVGAVLSSIVSAVIAIAIYRYTKRKDRTEFLRARWAEQQLVNMHQLESDANLVIFEKMVYGDSFEPTIKFSKQMFQSFLMLNQIQHYYFSYMHKIISKKEFHDYALPTLSLLHRQRHLVEYLLRERGYSEGFREEVARLFKDTSPPNLPPAQVADEDQAAAQSSK